MSAELIGDMRREIADLSWQLSYFQDQDIAMEYLFPNLKDAGKRRGLTDDALRAVSRRKHAEVKKLADEGLQRKPLSELTSDEWVLRCDAFLAENQFYEERRDEVQVRAVKAMKRKSAGLPELQVPIRMQLAELLVAETLRNAGKGRCIWRYQIMPRISRWS